MGSSPLARGALRHLGKRYRVEGIIPARAGSTLAEAVGGPVLPDHPRSRGEHALRAVEKRADRGSSPLARGARRRRRWQATTGRIIPARAGSTTISASWACVVRDHPRSRGEHSCSSGVTLRSPGSSPLARGAPSPEDVEDVEDGIIPARAGSTLLRSCQRQMCRDHPRSRGEHSLLPRLPPRWAGSSPLARGALGHGLRLGTPHGIIPARAGSTGVCPCNRRVAGDHPRSRGEHASASAPAPIVWGSSPLARGARPARATTRD